MATVRDYCVVYVVCGIHYRYRCCADNKRQARRECHEAMGVKYADIVDCYEEGAYRRML